MPMSSYMFSKKSDVREIASWYARWAPQILRFCHLFLGDENMAEKATAGAFVRFFSTGKQRTSEGVPVALLRLAFQIASQFPTAPAQNLDPLRAAILQLTPTERAVFILRGVLLVQRPWVAAILGTSAENANQFWAKALIEIRESLPRECFKERQR